MKAFIPVLLSIILYPGLAQTSLQVGSATNKTEYLYKNLEPLASKGFMFGHQDDMAYGVNWWAEKGKSDVKAVTGSYPAVHGWDVGYLYRAYNIDSVDFEDMRNWIKEVYRQGGINTFSWHIKNPLSGGNSWDTQPAIAEILPGGSAHSQYLRQLDDLAKFALSLKSSFHQIPIIFRPFHEHNGDWFWWGKGLCTEEEYIALWRFTVDYLRETKGVNHFIYAFSPDRSRMDIDNLRTDYFYGYPGDDYVDIIGLDNYWDVGRDINQDPIELQIEKFKAGLALIDSIAKEKNKPAALTETGLEGVTDSVWFTRHLLEPIMEIEELKLSWVLVWRNANKKHHYAAYPNHFATDDMIKFYESPITIFESNLKRTYKKNGAGIKK